MGRRTLRKIDPALDLSFHLIEWAQVSEPMDVTRFFSRGAPLELEVGSGKGLFLVNAAAANPERNFLGIEIAAKYARFAAARLARGGMRNARLIHGDARELVQQRLADASVHAIHVYFPDPWWKKRHLKRRLMNPTMARHMERVLLPGGTLHFWTDVESYFQETLAVLAQWTSFGGPILESEQVATHPLDYRTHFERRMRLHAATVYRARYQRNTNPDQDPASAS